MSLQPLKALVQLHLAQLHLAESAVLVLRSKLLRTADCRQSALFDKQQSKLQSGRA